VPEWPLPGEPDPESQCALLWSEMWTMPQAIMWERHRRYIEVALYVTAVVAIFVGPDPDAKVDITPTLRSLVLRQQDALGLTSGSLTRHRWRIADAEPTPAAKPARNDDPDRSSAKARFQRLQGGKTA
jgi:hypothetical protein